MSEKPLAELSVDELLRAVFPVEQELAEADGVADDATCQAWTEVRRRLEQEEKRRPRRSRPTGR